MKKKIKILIINPNSDRAMTKAIEKTAEKFAGEDLEVLCLPTPGAPKFIETREDEILAAPGMIEIAKRNKDKFDAFVIACHGDPNREVIEEITGKPVFGIGESSMRIASMLGHRFSIIQTTEESIPHKVDLVKKYRLQDFLASVRAPMGAASEESDEVRYLEAAKRAVTEDKADVIVLGCAGLTGLDKHMQEELDVPVLDGVICALILATAVKI